MPLSASPLEPTISESAAEPAPGRLLADAHKRLRAALDGLGVALSRHQERALEQADQAAEYAALQEDRSRLAQELDAATVHLRALETAQGEAARRVERASAAVRAVLAADKGHGAAHDSAQDSAQNLAREG